MKTGVIYKVYFTNCKYFIIGSSYRLRKRMNTYKNLLKQGKWYNEYLQKVYNKYGEENLKFEILQDNIPVEILKSVEDVYIGALCGRAEDEKGGMNLTDALRPRYSQKTIDKIKERIKDKQLIPVVALYLNGDFHSEYKSVQEAAEKLKLQGSGISCCLTKTYSTTDKYQFIYKKDYVKTKDYRSDIFKENIIGFEVQMLQHEGYKHKEIEKILNLSAKNIEVARRRQIRRFKTSIKNGIVELNIPYDPIGVVYDTLENKK